ncbi:hypothetical protein AURDEDRAFT_167562 [Auricularia subglabra TFB-10046 SS5]|nr:hypothetical protein AURDEDRAFT_167562 [Auricularia subglabra TFB-10046 SS5]
MTERHFHCPGCKRAFSFFWLRLTDRHPSETMDELRMRMGRCWRAHCPETPIEDREHVRHALEEVFKAVELDGFDRTDILMRGIAPARPRPSTYMAATMSRPQPASTLRTLYMYLWLLVNPPAGNESPSSHRRRASRMFSHAQQCCDPETVVTLHSEFLTVYDALGVWNLQ